MNKDERLEALLGLDPEAQDAGYWVEFRRQVLDRAVGELARRREQVRLSIPGVLSGWSRSLIPVSLAAAVIAGIMVMSERQAVDAPVPLALEELSRAETEDGPFDDVMEGTIDWAPTAAFMTLVEGEVPQ
ncbi:MAG: hypothetical protein ACR2QM_10160 [Longimicrobiales bacterium]